MWLETIKSNLTEINNSIDTLFVRKYPLSFDTNKHETDMKKEAAPKYSPALPPPPLSLNTTTINHCNHTSNTTMGVKK